MLFRWFVGLGMDDAIWDVSTFSKNRERFLSGEISDKFFAAVVEIVRENNLASDDYFTVDGTLLQAWASHKSFKPKNDDDNPPSSGRNPDVDLTGTTRKSDTHESTTDADARLYRKSRNTSSVIGYLAHALMENRNGLIVGIRTTRATGTAEREAAIELIRGVGGARRIALCAAKVYDPHPFVAELRAMSVTPYIARNLSRSAIDVGTTRHAGYEASHRKRKRVEEIFGWAKATANRREVHYRGLRLVSETVRWTSIAF